MSRPPATTITMEVERDRAEELRRWDRRALLVLALLLGLCLLPGLGWIFSPKHRAAVLVVDKTVAHENFREHTGLMWWMSHRRLLTPKGGAWETAYDYRGYDPVRRKGELIDSAALAGQRLLYIADAYGVYTGDYTESSRPPAEGRPRDTTRAGLERSRLLYGGITVGEASAIADFSRRGGAVVAEFNTLESPTYGTAAEDILAGVVGARYLGWLGRWYADLGSADEIPRWMRDRYARNAGAPWRFTGPGLVFFGEGEERIVVIPARHFTDDFPITVEVDRRDDPLVKHVIAGRPYWYWMAGVAPTDSATVLASFQLHVDIAAQQALARIGFPERFPAVVRRRGAPLGAYLAGDFADVGGELPSFRRTRFVDQLRRWLARDAGKAGSMREAWWAVTTPLWTAMLEEAKVSP